MNKTTKYAGTQTEKNLMAAFAGESEARNKYTYFASKAKITYAADTAKIHCFLSAAAIKPACTIKEIKPNIISRPITLLGIR